LSDVLDFLQGLCLFGQNKYEDFDAEVARKESESEESTTTSTTTESIPPPSTPPSRQEEEEGRTSFSTISAENLARLNIAGTVLLLAILFGLYIGFA